MSYDDIFERMRRRALRIVRDVMSEFDEMEAWLRSMMDELEETIRPENLLDERLSELRRGALKPLASIYDAGSELVITIDLPGSDARTIDIKVSPNSVRVEASVRSELVRRAFGETYWARNISKYEGEYALPATVDPSTARVSVRSGMVVIRVRKAAR
ncbi:MAG: Hsp20/alpha crystallin family protein [Acidilobus sp.]